MTLSIKPYLENSYIVQPSIFVGVWTNKIAIENIWTISSIRSSSQTGTADNPENVICQQDIWVNDGFMKF